MDNILIAQFADLAVTAGLFAGAFALGLHNMRRAAAAQTPTPDKSATPPSMGFPARALLALAILSGIALLIWRAGTEGNNTIPLANHFDAFLLLAMLLAVALVYFRKTRNLRGFSFFMLPMIAGLLVLGGILELIAPGTYQYQTAWDWIHIITVVTGTVCFALACVGAVVYLLAAKKLKRKGAMGPTGTPATALKFPPLASLEKFNQWMIYFGFPLLTIAMIAGGVRMAEGHLGQTTGASAWQMSPKVLLAVLAWLIYGILLHIPLAPSFRGQHAAWLSIVGFVLFMGGYAATKWMK